MNALPARGTPWWIALFWVPAAVVRPRVLRLLAVLGAGAVTSFFRDPDRTPRGEGLLAAADGLVREVEQREDGRWFVSTYLALYNVHVGRMPCDATIVSQEHFEGEHRMAFDSNAHVNERLEWRMETEYGDLEMVQFSGAAARRIVPYVGVGTRVRRGERIGLIRFGSRVDLLLPRGLRPTVAVGDRPRGAQDVIAVPDGPHAVDSSAGVA
ncbi:phosphatidylserine decarboxylase [Nocardioides sp. KIGAM211]|uniref:Phosphatidylserine decarboxylase n=1 Tax=Nocardioides luti TaxID=2761101 RepID=A0A7X0VC74_9ACTN|nr:phosphatidylserine decarboxylase [Nocardioides luti]MBB6629456.1 phosphatidylserine decarboxylase [Nocardioides luti]